jgi:type I restriction enzyme S subunit
MSGNYEELINLCDQIRGVSYKPFECSTIPKNNFIPIYRAHNIQSNGLNDNDLVYVLKDNIADYQYIRKGDIIICASSGSKDLVGKAAQSEMDCNYSFGTFCKVIRPNKNVDSKYLGFYFRSKEYRSYISSISKGSNINNLRNEDFDSIKIPFPSLEEQKRIVKIIETKLTAVEKAKKASDEQINLVESLEFSYFQKIYNNTSKHWKNKKWDELFNTKTGKLNSNSMEENGEYPFFTCSKDIFRINKYAFDCEALLLAGNNAAGVYDVKYYNGKFNAYQRTYILTLVDKDNDYQFFKYCLEQKLKLMKYLSKGSNTRFLTIKILSTLNFLVPLKNEQERIINELKLKSEAIKKIHSYLYEQSSYINALPSSILRKAFNGEY